MTNKTPYLEINKSKIQNNYHDFIRLFDGSKIFYAMKCNSIRQVLETLRDAGSGFEIASAGELDILLSIGVLTDMIIYSNPVKSLESIKYAYEKGVKIFAFDSLPELDKIAGVSNDIKVFLRLAVPERGSRFSLSSKFGAKPEVAMELIEYSKKIGLNIAGLSFHVGSQAERIKQWEEAINSISDAIDRISTMGHNLEFLNIGGGFPVDYANTKGASLESIAGEVKEACIANKISLPIFIEPGRRMVANSADMVATVIARVERDGKDWIFLDVGAYNGVFEAMSYQGEIVFEITLDSRASSAPMNEFVVTGPSCDSLDTISYGSLLPEDVAVGDRVRIHNLGAYSMCFATNFNGFSIPDIVFVD